jgi:hypothetical protein
MAKAIVYRTINRFPGYRFGSDGSVWTRYNHRNKRLGDTWRSKPLTPNAYGYLVTSVYAKPYQVSRLICEAFKGPPPTPKHEAAHWDRNPKNNRPSNLRWATKMQNYKDRERHGTWPRGENNGRAFLTPDVIRSIRSEKKRGDHIKVIAARHRIAVSSAYSICNGWSWPHITD